MQASAAITPKWPAAPRFQRILAKPTPGFRGQSDVFAAGPKWTFEVNECPTKADFMVSLLEYLPAGNRIKFQSARLAVVTLATVKMGNSRAAMLQKRTFWPNW